MAHSNFVFVLELNFFLSLNAFQFCNLCYVLNYLHSQNVQMNENESSLHVTDILNGAYVSSVGHSCKSPSSLCLVLAFQRIQTR